MTARMGAYEMTLEEREKYHEENCKILKKMGYLKNSWEFLGEPYMDRSGFVSRCKICGSEVYFESRGDRHMAAYSYKWFAKPDFDYWYNRRKILNVISSK